MKKGLLIFAVCSSLILSGCLAKSATSDAPVVAVPGGNGTVVMAEQKIIPVQASRFQFAPATITVKQGENVALAIQDIDTRHGAYFTNMKTTTDAAGNIILDTSVPGTYTFACATMCGHGHRTMQGTVIVQ